jgi:hypothetical protein
MKKIAAFSLLLAGTSLLAFGQGFYFDAGFGLGKGWTTMGGENMAALFSGVDEIAAGLGIRAGYGPFGKLPLYTALEFSGVGHRFYDSSNYLQFDAFLAGPAVIFYPLSLLQLSLAAGYSFPVNINDLGLELDKGRGGFAFNVQAALDAGTSSHGLLLAAGYFYSSNKLEASGTKQVTSLLGLFMKYAYRRRPSP